MPLKKPDSTSSTNTESSTKRKKTSDPTLEPLEQTQMETFSDDDDIEEDRTEDWLKEMGVTSTDIRRIQSTQSDLRMGEEREIDRTPESLIYVQGTEAQALFNFLVNCKSCVATTGYLTGVPPTLISPVCFHSASLQYLQ
ncbi:protein downstream neighbor of son homolog, partial [Diaphorina citri]|uniref:Protein downstream neighbor of son homolog n=1 Tax=Diaphorina citri TaxID=121845 RepID=A0A1S3DME4_DIACI